MDRIVQSRRTLLKGGGAAVAALGVSRLALPASAFQTDPATEVIPWLDQPEPNPIPDVLGRQLVWEELDAWLTPPDQFFTIKHYNQPADRAGLATGDRRPGGPTDNADTGGSPGSGPAMK